MNKVPSETAVSVCHDLPTGAEDTGILDNICQRCHIQTNDNKYAFIINVWSWSKQQKQNR